MSHAIPRRLALGLPFVVAGGLARPGAGLAQPMPASAEAGSLPGADELRAEWDAFRGRYLAREGRVVDTGNKNISHSEGQGYALLVAVRADDRASFDLMLGWTRRTLKRRGDNLLAWRFQPDAANPVADQNNAADGDLLVAWALLEAGRRWGNADHSALGTAMARDVLKHLVRRSGGYTVLLPGVRGFDRRDRTVLNPSYYVFPAIRALAQAVPDPAWVRLAADGLALLRAGRFGRWRLPADWVALAKADGAVSLAENFPPRFSYDAVRVPLYLSWAKLGAEPAVADSAGFWGDSSHSYLPAWVDLTSNAIAPYAASSGIAAVARLASSQRGKASVEARVMPRVAAATDYYAAVLGLLVRLAWRDIVAPTV
jgi:endoglucanase